MNKENLSIESSNEDLTNIVSKITNLKDKIGKEINNINILYEKAVNDLTKDFNEKIEKLKKEETEIKEKLDNEVTKVKEKLENFFSETNILINLSEKIQKGIKKLNKEEKNKIKILSFISKINENKIDMNTLLKRSIKSFRFSYLKEKNDINYEEFDVNREFSLLKKIEKGSCQFEYKESDYGRILFDEISNKTFYIPNYFNNKINVYKDFENLKTKNYEAIIELPHKISVNYSVMHKGYFYYFKYNTNNIIKYDLNNKQIIIDKIILSDANLENQNQWGGNNNINLVSDDNKLYAIYSSNNNNKRLSIALLNEDNLNVIKTWNTDSLEKKKCGPIFMIKGILYHIKSYNKENDSVIYYYDLNKEKSSKIEIPFENLGGYDTSLTYYPHLNCLMTVNNAKIYKYKVILGSE